MSVLVRVLLFGVRSGLGIKLSGTSPLRFWGVGSPTTSLNLRYIGFAFLLCWVVDVVQQYLFDEFLPFELI